MDRIMIRRETEADYDVVENLVREAFWNLFVPGCDEHLCLRNLRASADFIPELDFVAELDGRIVGQIVYTHARIVRADGSKLPAVCFGPVAVLPECQKMGIGGALIRHSLEEAARLGFERCLIYGDPRYYSRFGFRSGEVYGISASDGVFAVALLALALKDGALKDAAGRFVESPDFVVDEAELLEFEKRFPPKEKAVIDSQRDFKVLVSLRY